MRKRKPSPRRKLETTPHQPQDRLAEIQDVQQQIETKHRDGRVIRTAADFKSLERAIAALTERLSALLMAEATQVALDDSENRHRARSSARGAGRTIKDQGRRDVALRTTCGPILIRATYLSRNCDRGKTGKGMYPILFCLLFLAASFRVSFASQFLPFPNCRIVDSEGRYYVVVERVGGPKFDRPYGPVSLRIAERRPGSTRVEATTARAKTVGSHYIMSETSGVVIRDKDIVHGKILVPETPSTILVPSKGMGVILLDLYGPNYAVASHEGSNAISMFTIKGDLRRHFKLDELFGESVLRDFKRGNGNESIRWLNYAWIDEPRKLLVIVSPNTIKGIRHFRKIDLTTFTISGGGINDVLNIISTPSSSSLGDALDLLEEFDHVAARESLANIVENEELPLMSRLKAGVLLAPLGDHRVRRLLIKAALLAPRDAGGKIQNRGAITFAVEHSVEILGVDALPLLDRVIQRSGDSISVHSFSSAYRRLGSRSIPALCKLVEDGRPGVESTAAEVLGRLGPDAEMAIPYLVRALRRKTTDGAGWRTDKAAVVALGRIGFKAKVAIPDLLDLLRTGDEEIRRSVLETLKLLRGVEEAKH